MELDERILERLRGVEDPLTPLPTTRVLGEEFGVSHVTVSRVLRRMADGGRIWQAESGRYYRPEAEATLARVWPVSCLVRSLSGWSAWYEQIMRGVSQACEEQGRGMLLHPVPGLLRQERPDGLATYASEAEQREVFELFLRQKDENRGFVLLDDAWADEVLAEYAGRLNAPRMFLRPSPDPGISAFYPDFAHGAMLGLSHLLGRGFKRFVFVQSYPDYLTPRHFQEAFREAFESVGEIGATLEVFESDGARRFPELITRLGKESGRVALVCPEDNFAIALYRAVTSAGLAVPDRIGLLAGMGSPFLTEANLTRVTIDFAELGRRAVDGPVRPKNSPSVAFSLTSGATT